MNLKNSLEKFIPPFLLSWYHFLLAFLGAFFYGFPSRKLKVIGVTGTGGKSTVVEFCHQILKEAGYKVASISSIKFKIGDKEWRNELKMTMPGRLKVQRFLRQAVKAGCSYAVLEVTSEGILQHRQKFIDFDVAVFTNLSPEHIEHHGSFEKYRTAKGKLFEQCKKIHIINLDDKNSEYFLKFPASEKWGYRIKNQESGIRGQELDKNLKSVEARITQTDEEHLSFLIHNSLFIIPLIGEFNIYNALAAICVGLSQGIDLATCQRALAKVKGMPGRMEIVIKEPFQVIVDYAHTPDSLEKVYKTIRNSKSKILNSKQILNSKFQKSKMICVLGSCGGGRDKWKRPKLGEIAAKYCDEIIITNEDPYDESPQQIMDQIEEGISINQPNQHKSAAYKILDRRTAIKKALKSAKPNDVVIITGKGSEPWMCVAEGKKISWDDREIVKQEFKKLNL